MESKESGVMCLWSTGGHGEGGRGGGLPAVGRASTSLGKVTMHKV